VLREVVADGPQAELGLDLALGPAEITHQNHRGAAFERGTDRRQRRHDPIVVVDAAVADRHIEIDPHQDLFPIQIQVVDAQLVHTGLRNAITDSG